MPAVIQGYIRQAGLDGVGPFREAVSIPVLCRAEPVVQVAHQGGNHILQPGVIRPAGINPGCQFGKDGLGGVPGALPSQPGFSADEPIFILHGKEIAQHSLCQFRCTRQQCGKVPRFQRSLSVPQVGVVAAVAAQGEAMLRLA